MVITLQKKVPGPVRTLVEHLKERLKRRGRVKPFDEIQQTKNFLRAKLEGATNKEAFQLARLSPTTPVAKIIDSPTTQNILQEMAKHVQFSDEGITQRLKEMWTHKRVRYQKVGDEVEIIHEDDTDMWKYSMDKVLNLKGYVKKDGDAIHNSLEATGGVTFNVLQINNDNK